MSIYIQLNNKVLLLSMYSTFSVLKTSRVLRYIWQLWFKHII